MNCETETGVKATVVKAGDIRPGDRIRVRGHELTVSRIDRPFMGHQEMLAFVEDSDTRWLKVPVAVEAKVEQLPV